MFRWPEQFDRNDPAILREAAERMRRARHETMPIPGIRPGDEQYAFVASFTTQPATTAIQKERTR